MIHLPQTLSYRGWPGLTKFIEKAKKDLKALEAGGAHAALIENDGDSPCKVYGEADVIVPMTIVAHELAKIAKIPLGVEVLLNDPKASLAIAKTAGLHFIRTDYFVDKMIRKEYGEFKIDPRGLMEYKKQIGAEAIQIFADIQVKYATMIDQKKTISQSIKEAIKEGANGVIISGSITGEQPLVNDVKEAKQTAKGKIPVIIGSGFSQNNARELFDWADWAIVGTSIKTGEHVDEKKVKRLIKVINKN